jgi:hypothetical protein
MVSVSSHCLGLDQQFSPGGKTGHHRGKNANRNIHVTCPICRLETETITHVITSCSLYNDIRKEHFVKIKGTVITAIGFDS